MVPSSPNIKYIRGYAQTAADALAIEAFPTEQKSSSGDGIPGSYEIGKTNYLELEGSALSLLSSDMFSASNGVESLKVVKINGHYYLTFVVPSSYSSYGVAIFLYNTTYSGVLCHGYPKS